MDSVHRKRRDMPKPRMRNRSEDPIVSHHRPGTFKTLLISTGEFFLELLLLVAQYLKPFIAAMIACWIIIGVLIFSWNSLSAGVSRALLPLCRIPGANLIVPACELFREPDVPQVRFNGLVEAQDAIADVLKDSSRGTYLPIALKQSEGSMKDLRHAVQISTLPSKDELVTEFSSFVSSARDVGDELITYNSRIGRAIDGIIITNQWTLQTLDEIKSVESARSTVGKALSSVFAPFLIPGIPSRKKLFDAYLDHLGAVEHEIEQTIVQGTRLAILLKELDDQLDNINGIAKRDKLKTSGDRNALLPELWKLSMTKWSNLFKFNKQLALLTDVERYHKEAWALVTGTIVKLRQIQAQNEDLRDSISRPQIEGAERLEYSIERHAKDIQMAVDRLEAVRVEGRQIAGERMKAIEQGAINRASMRSLDQ